MSRTVESFTSSNSVQVHLVRAPERLLQKEKQKDTAVTETVIQHDVEMAE